MKIIPLKALRRYKTWRKDLVAGELALAKRALEGLERERADTLLELESCEADLRARLSSGDLSIPSIQSLSVMIAHKSAQLDAVDKRVDNAEKLVASAAASLEERLKEEKVVERVSHRIRARREAAVSRASEKAADELWLIRRK